MKSYDADMTGPLETEEAPGTGQPHAAQSVLIGTLVGCVFIILLSRDISWGELSQQLHSAHVGTILAGVGCYGLYLFTRALRWSFILAERSKQRPFGMLFRTVVWGTAANAVVPHSGEVIRSLATKKRLGISAAAILGTIAAERLFDFAVLVALTATVLFLYPDMPPLLSKTLIGVCLVGGMILAGLGAIGLMFDQIVRLAKIPLNLLPETQRRRIVASVKELSGGVKFAIFNKHKIPILLLSLVQWLCVAFCIYAGMTSVGAGLPSWVALVVLPLTVAGLMLPTAPGYVGTLQLCFVVAMTPFGVSNETAIAASISYTCIVALPVMVLSGIWYALYIMLTRKYL